MCSVPIKKQTNEKLKFIFLLPCFGSLLPLAQHNFQPLFSENCPPYSQKANRQIRQQPVNIVGHLAAKHSSNGHNHNCKWIILRICWQRGWRYAKDIDTFLLPQSVSPLQVQKELSVFFHRFNTMPHHWNIIDRFQVNLHDIYVQFNGTKLHVYSL